MLIVSPTNMGQFGGTLPASLLVQCTPLDIFQIFSNDYYLYRKWGFCHPELCVFVIHCQIQIANRFPPQLHPYLSWTRILCPYNGDPPPHPNCKKVGFPQFVRQVFYKCDYLEKWRSIIHMVITPQISHPIIFNDQY
jgi:hypothetical protein